MATVIPEPKFALQTPKAMQLEWVTRYTGCNYYLIELVNDNRLIVSFLEIFHEKS